MLSGLNYWGRSINETGTGESSSTEKYSGWSRLMEAGNYDRSADLTAEERAEMRRLTDQGLQSRS